ncbi:regulator of (H+)-ATPase in vacuolar membrane [Scheffersomyces spartinae]|uniref:Regulator of (H+)-ATPase in vacuolar membrane n=1 Tax=Scheffersomyces spartinae TaxID=45513 RepID=A0A9P7V699_9ASCO|nr:regulator of (H+)-ATPase in vacuolar membrane [Scheffersomyces spartinae]KAG7191970.1 regulator of (H+)-ATPase in vacuolar membrane [Scheffersomyces spartinae]
MTEISKIDHINGLIFVAVTNKVLVFKPVNEYMKIPKWTQCLVLELDGRDDLANCISWAPFEDELIIGSTKALHLYHIYNEFGQWIATKRWHMDQPLPVYQIKITTTSSRIVVSSGAYDRFIKVWSRIKYGDDNTLFGLSYITLPRGKFVIDLQWRLISLAEYASTSSKDELDGSMANIKNIRGYIHTTSTDNNDVLYVFTNDRTLSAYGTYEYNGHGHIKELSSLDLNSAFDDPNAVAVSYLIVDNGAISCAFLSSFGLYIDEFENKDLIFVCNLEGKMAAYLIGINPLSLVFQRVPQLDFNFTLECFPDFDSGVLCEQLEEVQLSPIIFPRIVSVGKENQLVLLLFDRIKNSIRFQIVYVVTNNADRTTKVVSKLYDKLQGHTKSIRKLFSSNSSDPLRSVLLSILNFPEFNYIWEPLILDPVDGQMTISKSFTLSVTRDDSDGDTDACGIFKAALLNDISPPNGRYRHHLVVLAEKGGYISLWNCEGGKSSKDCAELIQRLPILATDLSNKILDEPKAFILTSMPDDPKTYFVISIFENNLIRGWLLKINSNKITLNNTELPDAYLSPIKVDNLPQTERIRQIAVIDSIVTEDRKDVVSVIDSKGKLTVFSLDWNDTFKTASWMPSTLVHTNISNASFIHGSSMINKFAIVDESGCKLTIWDTKSRLLEYEEEFPPSKRGQIKDIDWTFLKAGKYSTSNALLSVGFERCVLLYCQLRYDYTNNYPSFAMIKKIDISSYTLHEIGDSIWLSDAHLVIGSGNQFFIDDKWVKLGSTHLDLIIRELMVGYTEGEHHYGKTAKEKKELVYGVDYLSNVLNGPLPIYHPQFLIQSLFLNQELFVKNILVRLFNCLRRGTELTWDLGINVYDELLYGKHISAVQTASSSVSDFSQLDVFQDYNQELSNLLVSNLMKVTVPLLTRHQQITLISLIGIIDEIDKFALSLDENGMRFLIGYKLFQKSSKQSEVTMRDINWALHSDSKEVLEGIIVNDFKSRMKWENIKQVGFAYWLHPRQLVKIIEQCARTEFNEERDPSGKVSLLYLAIRKKQILLGLWRTVPHSEQAKMLKFLKNNFNEPRWKLAALKNAFVLLSKHRYLDAAYFFLLADSVKDCCVTIANKMDDIQLALAVAKVYDFTKPPTEDKSKHCVQSIIENYIIAKAVQDGDRWTTSWVFWELDYRNLAIQALIKTPYRVVRDNWNIFSQLCIKNYLNGIVVATASKIYFKDDPALVILYGQLRNREHKDEINELDVLNKACLLYTRMGCDYLTIWLANNWKFIHEEQGSQNNKNGSSSTAVAPTIVSAPRTLIRRGSVLATPDLSNRSAPPPVAFEEPDMSAFGF